MRKQFLTIALLCLSIAGVSQSPLNMLRAKKAAGGGGGGNAYPLFVSYTATVFNTTTSPKTTASISVNNGDILVAFACNADNSEGTVSVDGGGLTWTERQHQFASSTSEVWGWTTTATSTTSFTVSFTQAATSGNFGGVVYVFRESGGYDNSSKATGTTAAPSSALTTVGNNCAIVSFVADWSAIDGASRTWRTINSITPTAGNGLEKLYFRDASIYTVYSGYWNDVGTAGSKTTGISSPSTMKYSLVSISIKGD